MEALVRKVKRAHRLSEECRTAWESYCDEELGGVRDPSRHEASILNGFLEWWASESGEVAGDVPPDALVDRVKRLQRSNPAAKQAWIQFCETETGGKCDPFLHKAEDLQAFLKQWESAQPADFPDEAPPDDLIEAVKNLQRKNPKGRQAWQEYCDNELHGLRDPKKHKAEALSGFLEWWASENGDGASTSPAPKAKTQNTPAKSVDFVRQGARLSPTFKSAWVQYCRHWGYTVSDPTKFDDQYFREFADYIAELISTDLAAPGNKRPAPSNGDEGPPAKKKLTLKKSVVQEIQRLNEEGGLSAPIRLGVVATQLSKLPEAAGLEVLAALVAEGDVQDPTDFICRHAEEAVIAGGEEFAEG